MSNETKDSGLSRRKLVDRLLPKQDSGPLIGLLGTTYKLQSDFFETDFLPTLLGLGAWDDRSWTSRVAMEKRLAEVEAAAILVDGKQYSGRPRSLRVSVHPVTPDGGGMLHAKILVRVHANAVRLQVGSANLTEPGYRRNREVVADLVASEKAPGLAGVITMALDQMEEGLGAWPESAALVTRQARAFLQNLKRIPQEPSEWFALSGPGRALWQTFLERWPVGEFIQSVTIVSPFWSDEDGADAPVAAFMTALRERGLAPGGRLRLLCDARKANNDNFQPVLPPSFATFDPSPFQIQAQAEAVDPCILPEEYGSDATGLARALHAKVILLEGPTSSLVYLGSANFTRRGWGFMPGRDSSNIEAGVMLLRKGAGRTEIAALVPRTAGEPVILKGAALNALALPEAKEPTPLWPDFLEDVRLTPDPTHPEKAQLEVVVTPTRIGGAWSILLGGDAGAWAWA